ncbi:SagB family peptide dehydrogenase [Salinithrix halophila]|uniref:SagB family peptide dehydrogenase n=1 Tax=Salinithrix halophila TaxID=1485204 RepID=A0ABV8JF57_9BACL
MSLEAFLHQLHFEISKTQPPDWEVDWEDAPLPYKLYRGLPVIPLSSEVPLTLKERETPVKPALREISHFLWYVFGVTQCFQSFHPLNPREQKIPMYRRFVPSGGALYPNELYVYLKIEDLPHGIYHYDGAHHRLVLIRKGNFDSYLTRTLGNRCDVSACFALAFVSVMFWKNFFKYKYLAYRLQGLDTGVLIGQLLEVARRFGFASGVYFQFLDRAVHHLLGLTEREESVYAMIPLSAEEGITWFADRNHRGAVSATELCEEITLVRHDYEVRSKRIREYQMLTRINEASLFESTSAFRTVNSEKNRSQKGQIVALPHVNRLSYDLAQACRKRISPGTDFVLEKMGQGQLASLLREATASFLYRNDLDEALEDSMPRVSLVGCLYGVEGIPDGAYSYDRTDHALRRVRSEDQRPRLQQEMSQHTVNLSQVPLCLHVAGDRNHLKRALGYRGYRIQQMEAGMLVQRLLLVASALGMGGHPLLDFHTNSCDELYKIDSQGKTTLIQIPIGPYRLRPWLQASLHR